MRKGTSNRIYLLIDSYLVLNLKGCIASIMWTTSFSFPLRFIHARTCSATSTEGLTLGNYPEPLYTVWSYVLQRVYGYMDVWMYLLT